MQKGWSVIQAFMIVKQNFRVLKNSIIASSVLFHFTFYITIFRRKYLNLIISKIIF